jgi:DNA modification methylase
MLAPDLFGGVLTGGRPRIDVLPCSVLEIGAQAGERRESGGHDAKSSRAEYSHFPHEVGSLCMQLYLREASQLFDPFAGWGERHADAVAAGKDYIGYDINPHAIAEAQRVYGVSNTLADSRTTPIPMFDGLVTCPPYWNLETYYQAGIENAQTFDRFIAEGLRPVFDRCYDAAQVGAVFCIMVGDWRQDGIYYDLAHQTRRMFDDFGATTLDEVIVSRRTVSKIKVMLPQAVRLGYTVKVHETLLVFQKR